jgi:hypothetical protein
MVMNFRLPKIAGKFLGNCRIVGFSRSAQIRDVSYVVS